MNPKIGIIAALSLSLSVSSGEIHADGGTPAEHYAKLFKEYGPVSGRMRQAATDLERKAAVESLSAYPSKFVNLAEHYPKDSIALKALQQAVQALSSTDSAAQIAWETNRVNFPAGGSGNASARTVALLMRDHVLSDEIFLVCDRLRYSYRLESGAFLRAVLETNPHREMQGVACLFLARFLNDRLRMVQLAKDRPDLVRRFEIVFGQDYLPALQRLERDGLAGTVERLFERAAEEYGEVTIPGGRTVGGQAESELYDIRHLAIGMIARDIKGPDQDGIEFKLSDYRGKVVLLYFWQEF